MISNCDLNKPIEYIIQFSNIDGPFGIGTDRSQAVNFWLGLRPKLYQFNVKLEEVELGKTNCWEIKLILSSNSYKEFEHLIRISIDSWRPKIYAILARTHEE